MEQFLQVLLSPILIFATLGIAAITFLLRTIIDYVLEKPYFSATKQSKFYLNVILPLLPIVIGAVLFLTFKTIPVPPEMISEAGRGLFGMISGMLSTITYRMIKSQIKAKIDTKMDEINNFMEMKKKLEDNEENQKDIDNTSPSA